MRLKKLYYLKIIKKLRNEVTQEKREGKKAYYTSFFETNKRKSAEIWKGIRSLVNIKSSKLSAIKLLDEDNNLVSDFKKNANTFNNHFYGAPLWDLFCCDFVKVLGAWNTSRRLMFTLPRTTQVFSRTNQC